MENALNNIAFTTWEIDIINHFFLRQIDRKEACAYAIQTELPLFEPHRFTKGLNELIFLKVSPHDLKNSVNLIEKQAEKNVELWNDHLCKMDNIRTEEDITKPEEFPLPVYRLKIFRDVNEYRYVEFGKVSKSEPTLPGEKIYYNRELAIYSAHINTMIFELLDNKGKAKNELNSVFNTAAGFEVAMGVLEDLEITVNGINNMKPGRAGKLIGAIVAIKETPGLLNADYSEVQLLSIFNNHLGTSYKTTKKTTSGFKEGYDAAKRYLKNNHKK